MNDILAGAQGVVFDMDGVLYRGDVAIKGAADAVAEIRKMALGVLFLTNNSTQTPEGYVDKLAGIGIPARPDEILTSALVTAAVCRDEGLAGKRAIVAGEEGVRRALEAVGIEIDEDPDSRRADVVVVGWDRGFDYTTLLRASSAARAGARFFATNRDPTFPHEDDLWPGAGSILAAIETAAGRRATVMGKPHEPMMKEAQRRLGDAGQDPSAIVMVGDRPETDLAGAHAMGWRTVLVLSGVASSSEGVEPVPDVVLESVAGLVAR